MKTFIALFCAVGFWLIIGEARENFLPPQQQRPQLELAALDFNLAPAEYTATAAAVPNFEEFRQAIAAPGLMAAQAYNPADREAWPALQTLYDPGSYPDSLKPAAKRPDNVLAYTAHKNKPLKHETPGVLPPYKREIVN